MEVITGQGKVKGSISYDASGEKYYKFQGIPYAKPPIGLLRFKVFPFFFIRIKVIFRHLNLLKNGWAF